MDAGANSKTKRECLDAQAVKLRERDRLWEYRFVCLLLLVLVGLATYHVIHSRIDDRLRTKIQEVLAAKLPNHLVAVESAHLEPGQGVWLDGVSIAVRTDTEPRILARIPRIIVQGDIDLVGLIQGHLPITRITMDAPEIAIWPLPNGRTSLETLSSDTQLPEILPAIDIRRGLIRIVPNTPTPSQELICHDLNVSLRGNPDKHADGSHAATLKAQLSSSFFSKLELVIDVSKDKKRWALRGNVHDLYYSSQWTDKLPNPWRNSLAQLSGFHGFVAAEFEVEKSSESMPERFLVHGSLREGRLQHPNLPYPLQDLSGAIFVANHSLQLRKAKARCGEAKFDLDADIHGLAVGAPMVAQMKVRELNLDERLYQALPTPMQEQWRKLRVAGVVDAEVTLRFDGKRWDPDVLVHAREGSVHADIFPYPVSNINGDFHYRDGVLLTDKLTAMAGNQIVRGWLRLAQASPKWLIDLSVSSDGPVAIDEVLVSALTPRGQPPTPLSEFVQSLAPTGLVHVENARFIRSADSIDTLSKSVELSFYGSSIRYSGFRYPIFDVQGRVFVDNQAIRLERLKGRNDSARIQCDGSAQYENNRLASFHLHFDGQNIPLEEELQAALPVGIRNLWSNLRPTGVIDRVLVDVERTSSDASLQLGVRIQEDGKDDSVAGRSVSLKPQSLPYMLNQVACDLHYLPGSVHLSRFEASHDLSHVSARGDFNVLGEGNWNGILTWLPTTRLNVDQSLVMALPEYMRNPLQATEFRGPLAISGQTLLVSNPANGEPAAKAWDLQIEVEDGQLAAGKIATGLRGSLHVLGENGDEGPMAKGFLSLDAIAVKGIPITNLTGPIAVANSKLLFGRLATPVQIAPLAAQLAMRRQASEIKTADFLGVPNDQTLRSQVIPASLTQGQPSLESIPPKIASNNPLLGYQVSEESPVLDLREDDLRAKALAGTVRLHGVHPLLEGQTELKLALVDADLEECLAELGESSNQVEGRLWVECRLAGSLAHANTLQGAGQAWLRQASFYQVPVMLDLFRALSMRPLKEGTFESADVQFRIDGDRIPLDRMSLDGDLISLRGNGWMNLRRELQLDLYAYVGNRNPIGALLGPVVSQNDSATMLRLAVSGTTDRMEFRRAIPLIGTNLQQVFPERVTQPQREP